MITRILVLLCLLPGAVLAQTAIGRSNPVTLNVSPGSSSRTLLEYTDVKLEDPNYTQALNANEKVLVWFKISNKSKTESQRLFVTTILTEPVAGLQVPEQIRIHPIQPGKEVKVVIPVQASADLESGIVTVAIEIREADVFEADSIEINLLTTESMSAATK